MFKGGRKPNTINSKYNRFVSANLQKIIMVNWYILLWYQSK